MLRVHLMPRAHDAALEKRERGFNGIGVNVAVSVLARMIDRAMLLTLHFVQRERVDRGFVRHNHFDVATEIGVDDLAHSSSFSVPCPDKAQIAVTLADADNHIRWPLCSPSALFSADIRLINFYSATQRLWRYFLHGFTNAMAEIPCGFVADSDGALNLASGHALFGLAEQCCSEKPFPEGQMGIVEDGARCYAKLVMA